jgi:two-component system LytT family response regulator
MITAIILEDEKNAGLLMRRMVESYHPDIKVAAVCFTVKEAEVALNKFKPQLLFLDIELGKSQTCFDLLKKVSPVDFDIIFTTAYSRYAMNALKLSAIDYLLKPIDKKELNAAIEKVRRKKLKMDAGKIENLLAAWDNPGSQQNKVHLPVEGGYKPFTIADIVYCESIKSQSLFLLTNETKVLVNMSLKECENILTPYKFYRIHRSFLVNLMHIKQINKSENGTTLMSNNTSLQVSKSLNNKLLNTLKTV